MNMRLKKPAEPLKLVFAAAVFGLFLYYMLWQVNFYLCESLRESYYTAAVPILVAGTLYFRRLKDGPEYILLLAYWLWLIISRFLNGDLALSRDYRLVLELSLMLPFLALGLALDREARRRLLNWISAFAGGYYFILGIICIVAFILRREFVNPITEGLLGIKTDGFERINILDINVCATACWFMFAFFLMVYQFFACKNKWWRIPIVIAGLVHYATVAMTYTRSVKLSLSLGVGLLFMFLVYTYGKGKKGRLLALLMAAAFLVSAPLCYKGFDLVTEGMGKISQTVLASQEEQPAAETEEQPEAKVLSAVIGEADTEEEQAAVDIFEDPRGWNGDLNSFSSGRIAIYKSALYAIGKDPSVLWRGKLIGDIMTLANEVLTPREQPHFHNFLIEVLMLTGLPGLFLIGAFSVLVTVKAIRLFFSREEKADLGAKVLILPVAAILIYSMFEACIFSASEIRSLAFYLICGIMLGFYYDVYPRKAK